MTSYKVPAVLWVLTLVGLVLALALDGMADLVSVTLLSAPLVTLAWYSSAALRRR